MKKKNQYWYLSVLSIVVFLGIWWLVTDGLHVFSETMLPSPFRVVKAFIEKFYNPKPEGATMLVHIASSLKTVLSGYLLGVVIGIPLGICMAWFKPVDRFLRPLFDLIKPIPGIAWIPVMITLFGIGLLGKAMIVFMTAFIACMVNAYSGIKQTRDVHLWVAQTFGASNLQQLFTVAIPTALPMIMTGLRVALGAAWSAVIAAELLASSSGIGFMIQQCRGLARPDIIIAGMIAYSAACVVGITLGLLMGWYPKVKAIFMPLFNIIRPIPPIAWTSLAILWFGLGEMPKWFIIFIAAFCNVVINAFDGARSVDTTLVGCAKMLGARDNQIFTKIVLPASVPYIFAGMQIALSNSWAAVVAAEMIRASEGLGWVIVTGMSVNNMKQIFAGIVIIGIIGLLLSIIMRTLEGRLLRWNRSGI